ncbi:MAG: hypothetical protein KAU21_07555, partial [Gammaproteobacteria bacterium]|nr:hypothetical protein [Gammaproteobacteria bacterium]
SAMKFIYFFVLSVILLSSCADEEIVMEKTDLASISDVTDEAWESLAKKKIYFGHQSVGENIIDGVLDVMKSNQAISLNFKEDIDKTSQSSPMFLHSSIGKNGDPIGKILDFKNKINNGLGDSVDIAFAKLCFWDIHGDTDVEKIFDTYKSTVTDLKSVYPETHFMHLTVPLMSHSDGIIDRLKRLIKEDNDDLANIKRNELNQLLVSEYKGKEPLFDIAKFESTYRDGKRSFFMKDGNKYYYLPDVYTNDGGHLNKIGRKHVAEQMLIILSVIATSKD